MQPKQRQSLPHILYLILAACWLLTSTPSHAALDNLDDDSLGEVSGQAFMKIDAEQYADPYGSGKTYKTTRLNFGLDVETVFNAKTMKLGQYNRADVPNSAVSNAADIEINDFALGVLEWKNSITGASYNKALPFKITDPYLEVAYESGKMVGLRLGFGTVLGHLSGDIKTLSGDVRTKVFEAGACVQKIFGACVAWADVSTMSKLVNGWSSGHLNGSSKGAATNIRAQYIGVPNGDPVVISNSTALGVNGTYASSGCNLSLFLGIINKPTCYQLSSYQTLEVGDLVNGIPGKGMFLSLANGNVPWRKDISNMTDNSQANMVRVNSGYWMNVPEGNLQVTFAQANAGLPRQKTCFGPYNQGC